MEKYNWMNEPRASPIYKAGVEEFMSHVCRKFGQDAVVRCPCRKCLNMSSHPQNVIKAHLLVDGIERWYRPWYCHGEQTTYESTSYSTASSSTQKGNEDMNDDLDDETVNEILDDLGALNEEFSSDPNTDGVNASTSWLELLTNESKEYLFPGENKYTKFSFLVKLLHLKVYGKFSKKVFDKLLDLLRDAVPAFKVLPKNSYDAYKYLNELRMGQEKIDVCMYDCMLFWNENKNALICSKCGTSRYKINDRVGKPIPQKVLRYFPLKPRLQRLFLSSKIAPSMTWHKDTQPLDDKWMSHPRDSEAWKQFNNNFPSFAAEGRNVYLALASDGFNPFGTMSQSYSMWPVILTTYNLPPWKCMKPEYFMMPLLIPGPKAPGMDIDVFLEPLINELIDLWENGLRTYDAAKKEWFCMRVVLLWTINDFPAYAILSGWQTKGFYACPCCKERTPFKRLRSKIGYIGCRCFLPMDHSWRTNVLKFDGMSEERPQPVDLTSDQLLHQFKSLQFMDHGKHPSNKKRYRNGPRHNWKKKSIFFRLPYWHKLSLRHNLDVMHVEKNILENILWTILDVDGKSKDTLKARLDLEDMNIRKELHLKKLPNGRYSVPKACYSMTVVERKKLCEFLKGVKLPDGYASQIGRCVDVTNGHIKGLKSHDCHVLLQRLLPVGLRGLLPKEVVKSISELGLMFSCLCKRKVSIEEVKKMQQDIVILLCKMEMIFPPAFFDIMVHLAIHLPKEVLLAGPVAYRWMYPIERFLRSLKQFVRNKARPEGSIAEAYIMHECLTWCSMYIDDMETRFNRKERNFDIDEPDALYVFNNKVRPFQPNYSPHLTEDNIQIAIWYILSNSPEVEPYLEEHRAILKEESLLNIETRQRESFPFWFKKKRICYICLHI